MTGFCDHDVAVVVPPRHSKPFRGLAAVQQLRSSTANKVNEKDIIAMAFNNFVVVIVHV